MILFHLDREVIDVSIIAAAKAKQGFNFMNCGADIMAISVWLGNEMSKMKTLMSEGQN